MDNPLLPSVLEKFPGVEAWRTAGRRQPLTARGGGGGDLQGRCRASLRWGSQHSRVHAQEGELSALGCAAALRRPRGLPEWQQQLSSGCCLAHAQSAVGQASSLPWPPDANDWDLKGLEMFVGSGGFLKPKRRAEAPKPAPAPAPPAAGGPAPAAAAASAPGAPAEKGYPAGRAAPAPAAITSGGRRLGRGARGRRRGGLGWLATAGL
ncbi:unnamed protein product [Prorocentrum cordatum]|uniref:Uncharacterized protein n=1 Tax=Prorocentrum cordatum TaxID=2364126 RepID=A0ABN9V2F8_9DINO|nr:unnamed protein product [Polarella glacialis]